MKQLKKSDFLAIITIAAMTKAEVVDALDEFDFIPSWLDYLVEHFVDQGKIIKEGKFNDGDGTICRKAAKGGAGPRMAYLVAEDEGEFVLSSRELEAGKSIDKDAGEATTANRAVKNRTSAIFAQYKADTATVRALLEDEAETES